MREILARGVAVGYIKGGRGMVDIINVILFIIALILTVRGTGWTYKRVVMLWKLKRLVKRYDGEVKLLRFPFLPNSLTSAKPDISVRILDTVYLIRLYSGGTRYSLVHFASEKFSVRYVKMASKWVARGGRHAIVDVAQAFTVRSRVFVTPPMKVPYEYERPDLKVEKILLFNPAPNAVSYVTPEKTRIKLAFTGDEFNGMRVFTGSSFVAYADRQTRKDDEMKYF